VSAKYKATGKSNSIKITASSGLSKDEVEKMKQDATKHEADDAQKREEAEVKNLAEQLIYTSEKALKDAGDKVPADLKKSIEDKIAALKKAKGEPNSTTPADIPAIKSATEALSGEIQKIGQYMNQQAGQAGGQSGSAGATGADSAGGARGAQPSGDQKPSEGDVKDAEFKEKK
jgi:molecular chaperone DnaK